MAEANNKPATNFISAPLDHPELFRWERVYTDKSRTRRILLVDRRRGRRLGINLRSRSLSGRARLRVPASAAGLFLEVHGRFVLTREIGGVFEGNRDYQVLVAIWLTDRIVEFC